MTLPTRKNLAGAVPLTLLFALFLSSQMHAQFPWSTSEVLLGTTNGDRTADDVVQAVGDQSTIYVTQTGSTSQQAILRFTLSRDASGSITGAGLDYTSLSGVDHNGVGLKSLDAYDPDTLYYTAEEGDDDTDGLIGRATSLAAEPVVHGAVADLTLVRLNTVAQYDPEGIAVDRDNDLLYVMTDDGPDSGVAQYSINPDLTLTLQWFVNVETGATNGNDGIVLPDGRVAVVAGSDSVNIYAVSQDGNTVNNLLGGAIGDSGVTRDAPQDLLVYGGHLYLAWESGIIDAFDLDSPTTAPVDSIDLDTIIAPLSIGGLALTDDRHLLVSTRAEGGSTGEIYAFNLDELFSDGFESGDTSTWSTP